MKRGDVRQAIEQLSEILADSNIESQLIWREQDGFNLYNTYRICACSDGVEVFDGNGVKKQFANLRTATSWCIAEKFHDYALSQTITRLDQQVTRLHRDLDVKQRLILQNKDKVQRFIMRTKIDQEQSRLVQAQQQLTKCINRAKYIQLRGFNDEIARTRQSTPTRQNSTSTRGTPRTRR